MPQSRSTVFPRLKKKDIWETNNDKTNAKHENSKNCNSEKVRRKTTWGLNWFYSPETSPIIVPNNKHIFFHENIPI